MLESQPYRPQGAANPMSQAAYESPC
jgi:hypothetical protein